MEHQEPENKIEETVEVVDFGSLFEGTEISQEVREKITTIFEAKVADKVDTEIKKVQEEFEAKFETTLEEAKAELTSQIDAFLDYAVEEWVEQNQVAIEQSLRNEITEEFIGKLKALFVESYVEVPEEKYDLLGEMETEVVSLKSKLDEQLAKNIEQNTKIQRLIRESIDTEVATGLTAVDADKFKVMTESVEFESESTYKEKITTIRENLFPKAGAPKHLDEAHSDEKIVETSLSVQSYVSALNKLSRI